MRIITIETCAKCPHVHENDGAGMCDPFTKCQKFGIMLFDWDGPEDFDIESGIHPDCELETVEHFLG